MATSPVTLDFSKAQPIGKGGVTLDFSKAQPLQPKPQTVTPTPGASIQASPTWGQQLSDLMHHPLNALDNASQPVSRPNNASMGEMAKADLNNAIAGAAGVIRHPINTVTGSLATLGGMVTAPFESMAGKKNLYQQTFDEANTNGPQFGATTLGQSAAMGAAGKVIKPIASASIDALKPAAQEAAGGLMDKTVGSLQSDFKRGAQPGKSYLQAGGTPAMSKASLASKGAALKAKVGGQIGSAIDSSTQAGAKIPLQEVGNVVANPVENARGVINGPGGTGNTATLDDFLRSYEPNFEDAARNGGFTPNDVFSMKKNTSANTSWSDPTQIGLKKVSQQVTGGLGGVLENHVPGLDDLNSQYQGLSNFAKRAQSRSLTGSSPLTGLYRKVALGGLGSILGVATHDPKMAAGGMLLGAAADSVPLRTARAYSLYHAPVMGKGLTGIFYPPPIANQNR